MKVRFGLRSLLILTAVSALFVAWIALPIYEKKKEVASAAALTKLVEDAETRSAPENAFGSGGILLTESVPRQFRSAFRRKFHSDKAITRVTSIDICNRMLTPEILDRLLEFKYLGEVSLNGTNLSDDQCRELGRLPNLKIIDCVQTPVSYETLRGMRRRNRRLGHLAHRRALHELLIANTWPHTDYDSPAKDDIFIDFTPDTRRYRILPAFKYVGRPVNSVRVSMYSLGDLRDPLWEKMIEARSDFRFDLHFQQGRRKSEGGFEFEVLSRQDFLRVCHDRVKSVVLSDLETEDVYFMVRSRPFESLEFRSVGPKLLETFSEAKVKSVKFEGVSELDPKLIPLSVEDLALRSCGGGSLDLSRCAKLRTLKIDGHWTAEQLTRLLDLPSLKEVRFRFSEKTNDEVVAAFKEKGVSLTLVPTAHGLPMQPQSLPLEIR